MKNFTYSHTRPDIKRFNEYSMGLHKRNLEKIKSVKSTIFDSREKIKIKKSLKLKISRDNDIYRENQILLLKLLNLSEGKLPRMRGDFLHPKSMNMLDRKQRAAKISKANREIAFRLATVTPSLRVNSLEEDYSRQMQYKSKPTRNLASHKSAYRKINNLHIAKAPSKDLIFQNLTSRDLKELACESPYKISSRKKWKIAAMASQNKPDYMIAVPIAL